MENADAMMEIKEASKKLSVVPLHTISYNCMQIYNYL